MNVFISGGCKNGKSMYAQNIARDMAQSQNVPLYYIATMIPTDDEDRARIRRHLSERDGWGFETIEQGRRICDALKAAASRGGGRNCPATADAQVNGTADGQGKGDAAVKVNPEGAFLLDSVTARFQTKCSLRTEQWILAQVSGWQRSLCGLHSRQEILFLYRTIFIPTDKSLILIQKATARRLRLSTAALQKCAAV